MQMLRFLLTTVDTGQPQSRIALRYLYSVVANAPIDSKVRYFTALDADDAIYEEIVRGGYNMVYFHCDMENEAKITHLCEIVKKAVPTSIVIVGGMQVTFETEDFMEEHPEVDYVFRGEGEQVLYDFIKTLILYEFDFESIPGLAYWDNDEIHVNRLGRPLRYEDIPFPYDYIGIDAGQTAYYESSRGCPDRCHYAQVLPVDSYRCLPLARVSTELRYFLAREVREVLFLDKWINFDAKRAYRIWQYIIDNDNGKTSFRFDVNGELLDEMTIDLLATARKGLLTFDIDIESTNPEALSVSGRKANIYPLLSNVDRLIRGTNVTVNVYQKIGLPYENTELFARSFNKIYALGADNMRVEALRLCKGTRLRHEASKYGYKFSRKPPYEVIANDFMKATEIIRIKMAVETAELFKDGAFDRSLARIGQDVGLRPFQLFMKLGEFIYKKGLAGRTGRKADLYRVLVAFTDTLYDEANITLQLQEVNDVILNDFEEAPAVDDVRKFERRGWDVDE